MHNSILSPPSDRGLGRIIDWVIYMLVWAAVGSALFYGLDVPAGWGLLASTLLLYAIETFMVYRGGASIGKRLIGERIVDNNGQPLSLGTAALRTSARLLWAHWWLFFIAVAIGAISAAMIFGSEDRRSIMDRVAKTRVRRAGDD